MVLARGAALVLVISSWIVVLPDVTRVLQWVQDLQLPIATSFSLICRKCAEDVLDIGELLAPGTRYARYHSMQPNLPFFCQISMDRTDLSHPKNRSTDTGGQ